MRSRSLPTGLNHEVEYADAKRVDRHGEGRLPGHEDDGHARAAAVNPLAERLSRHPRHDEVGQDDVDVLGDEKIERFMGRRERRHAITGPFERHREEDPLVFFVVDHEHVALVRVRRQLGCHPSGSLFASWSAEALSR
jgi:hypothetical protein